MPRFEIDVDPCDHITADAIGSPGQRVFYLQAYQEQRTITILIEKAQLQSLAIGVEQFLSQINQQNPDLEEAVGEFSEEQMRINPPVDPLFRAGEIGLGYDKERDRVVIFTKELLTEEVTLGGGCGKPRSSPLSAMWPADGTRRALLSKKEWTFALTFER
jgi:uncharacterized repeat protein (TIGR03847 family)